MDDRSAWAQLRPRDRFALGVFAALALVAMAFTGVTILARGDDRVFVVVLEQGAGQPDREAIRAACGDLPGVEPVVDRGNPDPRIQGRFPVRFDISGITNVQEADLIRCIGEQDNVRGYYVEGLD